MIHAESAYRNNGTTLLSEVVISRQFVVKQPPSYRCSRGRDVGVP